MNIWTLNINRLAAFGQGERAFKPPQNQQNWEAGELSLAIKQKIGLRLLLKLLVYFTVLFYCSILLIERRRHF